ncbi:hypothetical protein ACIRVK_41655, partial [Streptomyces sp. NPDC101152]
VHAGTAPRAMASLRNLAIGALKTLGAENVAKTTRAIRDEPARALPILGIAVNPDAFGRDGMAQRPGRPGRGRGVEGIAAGARSRRGGVMGDPRITDEFDRRAESYTAHCESGAPVEEGRYPWHK